MGSRKKTSDVSDLEASLTAEQIERAKQIVSEERELAASQKGQPAASEAIRNNEELPTTIRLGAADRMYLMMLAKRENKSFSQLVREIVQEGLAERLEQLAAKEVSEKAPDPKVIVLGPSELMDIAQVLGSIASRLAPGIQIVSKSATPSSAPIGHVGIGSGPASVVHKRVQVKSKARSKRD